MQRIFPRVEMHTGARLLRTHQADYSRVQPAGVVMHQGFVLIHADINYGKRMSSMGFRHQSVSFTPKFS